MYFSGGSLNEWEIISDVILSSVKSATDNQMRDIDSLITIRLKEQKTYFMTKTMYANISSIKNFI